MNAFFALAQDSYPITMIVPFAAGSTSDVIARVVAVPAEIENLGKLLGK